MPEEGWESVSIKQEIVRDLKRIYDSDSKKPANMKFGTYLQNLLLDWIEYDKATREYGAFLQFDGVDGRRISLFDNFTGHSVTVWIEGDGKKLVCGTHKSDDCVHVGFAYGVKEIYKALISNGFRPPKRMS